MEVGQIVFLIMPRVGECPLSHEDHMKQEIKDAHQKTYVLFQFLVLQKLLSLSSLEDILRDTTVLMEQQELKTLWKMDHLLV